MGSIIDILIFLIVIQSGQNQVLEFVNTSSRLLAPSSNHVALYDGDDYIFVIGSFATGYVTRYSIETGQVDIVADNFHFAGGPGVLEGEGITYFGGVSGQQTDAATDILSYSAVTNEFTVIGNSSAPMYLMSLAWDAEEGVAYLFGGTNEDSHPFDSVYRYDTRTRQLERVAELAFGRYSAGAAWNSENGVAYVFGGSRNGVAQEILIYDPKSSAGYVGRLETQIPVRLYQSCAVFAAMDAQIYVTSAEGLLRFDPDTEQIELLDVVGWPEQFLEAPCTYVPKMNRMYILGGRSGPNSAESDGISYVELIGGTPSTDDPQPPDLKHMLANARLPFPCHSAATVYDGHDSIYVLGGFDGKDMRNTVVKYSLESGSETVEVVGTFLYTFEGVAFMLDEDIIHVGGIIGQSTFSANIYNYSIALNSYDIIATIPVTPITPVAVAWDALSRTAYLYFQGKIYLYYPMVGDIHEVAEMEERVSGPTAVWHNQQDLNLVYTFGYDLTPDRGRGVVQFSPENGNASFTPTVLLYVLRLPCLALIEGNGVQIYAFGSPSRESGAGMVKFDPISQGAELAFVEAWPSLLDLASCAYIPRLKRLYIMGGYRSYEDEQSAITSHISYVQFGFLGEGSTTEEDDTFHTTDPSTTTTATESEMESGTSEALFLSFVIGGPLFALLILSCIGLKCYRGQLKNRKQRRSKSEKFERIVTQFLTDEEVKFFREGCNHSTSDKAARVAFDNPLLVECIPYNADYEVAKEDLKIDFGVKLGSGHFGIVYKGSVRHWKRTGPVPVAVKTVRSNAPVEYFKALVSELKILAHVGQHEYVASLIGAYTRNIQNGELFVAVELCKVSLLQYLRDQQHGYLEALPMTTGAEIDTPEYGKWEQCLPLSRWAHEIAAGMEFLSEKHVVHGDLAARNVLLCFDLHAKICDFGLARQLADYSYISTHAVNRPWKWMAIESLASLHFSTKSDVWAYGVTLWELFTLGNVPYPCAAWNLDFLNQLVAGYRLEKPGLASQEIYEKMCECWNQKKEDRPTFGDLKVFFMNELNQESSNVQRVNNENLYS